MRVIAYDKHLLQSDRWKNFLESTALGLGLNIAIVVDEGKNYLGLPSLCQFCQQPFDNLSSEDISLDIDHLSGEPVEFTVNNSGKKATITFLIEGVSMITRECLCRDADNSAFPTLYERTVIAQKLLPSFLKSLYEGFKGGQRAMEISTLRKMNQIILSLFQGDKNATSHSFDLILSALVILLDAQGSWIKLDSSSDDNLFIIGDKKLVESYIKETEYESALVEKIVNNGKVLGEIGVVGLPHIDKARELLPLLAQETAIIIEIDYLFKLLYNQISRVLGAIKSSVILVDQRENITYANKSVEKIFENSALELVGKPITSTGGPWVNYIKMHSQEAASGEMHPLNEGEDRKWIDWQVSPIIDDGSVMGWVILIDDRTEYFRWQEISRRAERMAITGTLVSSLAHEMRNPLSAAQGLLELIGRKPESHKIRGNIGLVMGEIDRITRLLNKFLLLGKPAKTGAEALNLEAFLNDLMPLVKGEAFGTGVEVSLKTNPVPPVIADREQLTQVIQNLIKNAIEASDSNGTVEINLEKADDDHVCLSVRDRGKGIAPNMMEKIFHPFYTEKDTGTGLGLAVVQAIVNNLGGSISAANVPEGGAEFTVALQIDKSEYDSVKKVDAIIVLEDEMVRYSSEQALRSAGFSVASVQSLEEIPSLGKYLTPELLIVEGNIINKDILIEIDKNYPHVKKLILGEINNYKQERTKPYPTLPMPVDYAQLLNKVQETLKKHASN